MHYPGKITFTASEDMEGGRAVKFGGSHDVTRTTSASDSVAGVTMGPASEGDPVAVLVTALVAKVKLGGSVSLGDYLEPGATGKFTSHSTGTQAAQVLEAGSSDDEVLARLLADRDDTSS